MRISFAKKGELRISFHLLLVIIDRSKDYLTGHSRYSFRPEMAYFVRTGDHLKMQVTIGPPQVNICMIVIPVVFILCKNHGKCRLCISQRYRG